MADADILVEPSAKDALPENDTPAAQADNTEQSKTHHDESKAVVTVNAQGKRVKKIIRKKRRPARVQVDPETIAKEAPAPTGTIFNIWYNKWSGGDREDKYTNKTHAVGRCNIVKDSGYTKADNTPGAFVCLHFARGVCYKGQDCEYLHRLPNSLDLYSGNVDCFGREKHSDYRDDMGGVGSFSRQNRTIYVGRIHPTDDIEEVVARHFQEWGPIERIRCLPSRGVGFVTYQTETYAQFAREAMAHQSLDHDEILNCRWATVDPNPASQKREARRTDEQAADAIRRILPPEYVAEIEGDPIAKRRRIEEGSFGLEGYRAPDKIWYQTQKAQMTSRLQEQNGTEAIEGPPEPQLLENGSTEENDSAVTADVPEPAQADFGIFGASTLAALKGYTAGQVKTGTIPSAPKPAAGPLVGYGSDSDDD